MNKALVVIERSDHDNWKPISYWLPTAEIVSNEEFRICYTALINIAIIKGDRSRDFIGVTVPSEGDEQLDVMTSFVKSRVNDNYVYKNSIIRKLRENVFTHKHLGR